MEREWLKSEHNFYFVCPKPKALVPWIDSTYVKLLSTSSASGNKENIGDQILENFCLGHHNYYNLLLSTDI